MTPERTFSFRLQSRHPAPDRSSTDLAVQWLDADGHWEPQRLDLAMPGFRIYLISLLLCQHLYLVANAQERRIPLGRVEAEFTVVASEDWMLRSVVGDFRIWLDGAGGAEGSEPGSADDLVSIEERMKVCPVSRNLPSGVHKHTTVRVMVDRGVNG